jgi:pilus assembly protein Flp/PilA
MWARSWSQFSIVKALIREDGQDLVEYALLIALLAFACVAGMGPLANGINNVFVEVGGKLTVA